MEIFPDDLVGLRIGPGDVTIDLFKGAAAGIEGEKRGRFISRLDSRLGKINGCSFHPRRGAGLQPSARKAQVLEKIRQSIGRILTDASSPRFFPAAMHESA